MPWVNKNGEIHYESEDSDLQEMKLKAGFPVDSTEWDHARAWYRERSPFPALSRWVKKKKILFLYRLVVASRQLNNRIRHRN